MPSFKHGAEAQPVKLEELLGALDEVVQVEVMTLNVSVVVVVTARSTQKPFKH